MTNDIKTTAVILTISSLILLSSAYVVEFNRWLAFSNDTQSVNKVPVQVGSTGIRQIVTSDMSGSRVNHSGTQGVNYSSAAEQGFQHDGGVPDSLNSIDLKRDISAKNAQSATPFNQASPSTAVPATLPYVIELEDEILIEFSDAYQHQQMKNVIVRLLTLSGYPEPNRLVANDAINSREKPYYFRRVLNQYHSPIRYPAQAYRFAEHLLANHLEQVDDEEGAFQLVRIAKNTYRMPQEIKSYHKWVMQYANQFRVEPELIYAIMKTESYFNPRAVSKSNALGLMQIKQKAAGMDVYRYIDNKNGYPSKQTLFNPQENIRIGVAYLSLLKEKYLKQVRNPQSKELLLIASYNGGLSKSLELFGSSPEKAVQRINQLYPRNIYRKLRQHHVSGETRAYVDKVLGNKTKYAKLMQELS